jgi:HSP90 family molecular chaperone
MDEAKEMANLLTDAALISSGFTVKNLNEFSKRVYGSM